MLLSSYARGDGCLGVDAGAGDRGLKVGAFLRGVANINSYVQHFMSAIGGVTAANINSYV
jgi:hypothetical protein